MAASKKKHHFTSLDIQKIVAWALFVLGIVYFAGVTTNEPQAPDVPPSPLDILWPILLLAVLPLVWLKRINELQGQKRYLSSVTIIVGIALAGLLTTSWGFYRQAQSYFVFQDELISQKFTAVNVVYEKRFSLVPNIAKSANSLANQERVIVGDITKARAAYLGAQNLDTKVDAINDFNKALTAISINLENYPDLKSDQGFLELMRTIEKTEDQLAATKNDYNYQVTTLNTQSRTFPYNFLAGGFIEDPIKDRIDSSIDPKTLDASHLLDSLD